MLLLAVIFLLVLLTVAIHYESIRWLAYALPRLEHSHRFRILFGVIGALIAHVLEIAVFAAAYYLMIRTGNLGYLIGTEVQAFYDCLYFSFTTYTTVGFGDIVAHGDIRYLAGVESLVGFVLITWTASYLFLEMQELWGDRESVDPAP